MWRFIFAGWYPWRTRAVPAGVPRNHPAAEVLAAFKGLTVGKTGRGIEVATSDIHFCHVETDEEIATWNELLGETLIGIAEVHHSDGELFIDRAGRCYGRSTVHDAFCFEGTTFVEAVEKLITGRRSQPMLRPDQESVELYGVTYTRGSPEVYAYNRPPRASETP